VRAARNGRGGAGAASACIVGAKSTTTHGACTWAVWGGGTGLIGGVHGPVRDSVRTGGQR
jgi:hypothetical protein